MKARGLGIRGLFRISICVSVVLACLSLATVSYMNVTADERSRAEASVRSEINYLCIQLESLGNRADAFDRVIDSSDIDSQELRAKNPEDYRLLSDPVGDILSGYTLAQTGTVFIIEDGKVIASDDARVPVGEDARAILGDEILGATDASLKSGEMQLVPYVGVFDSPGGASSYGDSDDEAYLLSGQQGRYTAVVIEPESMVFRDRLAVMGREVMVTLVALIVVFFLVGRLLGAMVADRIDKTNEALERITSGDLETHVEEKGTREFVSLASGINATVEALRGWIAEAKARMDSELCAARAIQESALPNTFPPYPDIPKFDIYAIMDAARMVGGDFYDFFLLGDSDSDSGKLVFLVADVSGKGVPAALFMMEAKTQVRHQLLSGLPLGQAIANANNELREGNSSCMFVTMWVGVLDYGTGHLEYVNAGHNHPLLWQEGIGWSWMKDRSGLPLGFMADGQYKTFAIDCHDGDKLFVYSDGVTEAESETMGEGKKMFGGDRLMAVVDAHSAANPEDLVNVVRAEVASFSQGVEQSDDITILALEIGPLSQ